METLKQTRGSSNSVAAIVNHPTRARCWYILSERVASPAELAHELGVDVGQTGYHVRELKKMGLVELVDERQVRGAVEHFYRAIERPVLHREHLEDVSPEESLANATRISQLLFAEMALSLDSGKLAERHDHAVIRYPMLLDEPGWRAMGELLEEFIERSYDIQAESDDRSNPETPRIAATAAGLLFERPTGKSDPSK